MSRIAQKLCDEIVDPAIKPSGESNTKSHCKYNSQCKLPSQCSSKRARSIIIEKKVASKINHNDHKADKSKLKETPIENNFNSKAANTDITGPLGCDTDCLTMVHSRCHKCSCKYIHKHMSSKSIPKTIQTLNNVKYILQTDKACINTVETTSCGTQFSDMLIERPGKSKSSGNGNSNIRSRSDSRSRGLRPEFYDFMGARRWALSQYQTHGPDF